MYNFHILKSILCICILAVCVYVCVHFLYFSAARTNDRNNKLIEMKGSHYVVVVQLLCLLAMYVRCCCCQHSYNFIAFVSLGLLYCISHLMYTKAEVYKQVLFYALNVKKVLYLYELNCVQKKSIQLVSVLYSTNVLKCDDW